MRNFSENELQSLSHFDSVMNHNDEYLKAIIHQEVDGNHVENLARFVEEDSHYPSRQTVISTHISDGYHISDLSPLGFRLPRNSTEL